MKLSQFGLTRMKEHSVVSIDVNFLLQVTIMDNTVQEARIHSNDLSNVATAAAAASIHLNTITSNNSINNITNANIQAATAAANAAVALATSSGIAAASTSGLIRFPFMFFIFVIFFRILLSFLCYFYAPTFQDRL